MFPIGNSHEVGSCNSHEGANLGLNSTEFNSKQEYLVPFWSHGGQRNQEWGGEDDQVMTN